MLDTNHQNPSCTFAEQLVSYLYGESGEQDKTQFELHLAACAKCADELAGFGLVRYSVQDWRTQEFSNLATPAIEIPFTFSPEIAAVAAEKRSRLADLRRFLTLSPAWGAAGAAFMILAMVAGSVFVMRSFYGGNDVADVIVNPQSSAAEQPIEKKSEQPKEIIAAVEPAKQDSSAEISAPLEAMAKIKNAPQTAPETSLAKTADNPRRAPKSEMIAQNVNKSARKIKVDNGGNAVAAETQKVPRLTEYKEVRDDSLRLSDLMAEVEK